MGAGKAKTKYVRVKVTSDVGERGEETFTIDQDRKLESRIARRYKDGLKKFNMTFNEVQTYCKLHGIHIAFGWGLIDRDGELVVGSNKDLRYHVFRSAQILVTIREKLREVGLLTHFETNSLFFDSPKSEGGDLDESVNGSFKAFENGLVTVNSGVYSVLSERALDYNRWHNRHRDQDLTTYPGERPTVAELGSFITNSRKSNRVWTVLGSTYAHGVVSHEIGHSLHCTLDSLGSRTVTTLLRDFRKYYTDYYLDPVSMYAQADFYEGFAECFALYVNGGKSESAMYRAFQHTMSELQLDSLYGCVADI